MSGPLDYLSVMSFYINGLINVLLSDYKPDALPPAQTQDQNSWWGSLAVENVAVVTGLAGQVLYFDAPLPTPSGLPALLTTITNNAAGAFQGAKPMGVKRVATTLNVGTPPPPVPYKALDNTMLAQLAQAGDPTAGFELILRGEASSTIEGPPMPAPASTIAGPRRPAPSFSIDAAELMRGSRTATTGGSAPAERPAPAAQPTPQSAELLNPPPGGQGGLPLGGPVMYETAEGKWIPYPLPAVGTTKHEGPDGKWR